MGIKEEKKGYIKMKHYSIQRGDFRLKDICLEIEKGEIFAILGKTGAGKTVLLEAICGMYRGDQGDVRIDGCPVVDIPVQQRKIGVVYQNYLLFPHMTVYENIVYGMKMNKYKKEQIEQKAEELLKMFDIERIRNQSVRTISGGESQRTAMARTLAVQPDILLLDEPFSALDPATKESIYKKIKEIHRNFGCTIIFVTHDFREAACLANRVGIVLNGELRAVVESEKLLTEAYDPEIQYFLGLTQEEKSI